MREFVFIFLYGAVTLAALFLGIFWGRFANKRRLSLGLGLSGLLQDRYYLLSTSIMLNSIGMFLLCGSRLIANVHYGLSRALHGFEGVGVAAGLAAVLLAKVTLVLVADLEEQPFIGTWTRWMAIATMVWGVAAIFISLGLPQLDFRESSNG